MATTFLRRFRNISIAKKLYFTVGIMAFLIVIELLTLWFAITTLSSVRAFVGGEGLWSKGEKDAVYALQQYGQSHDENDYQNFLNFMKVPLGDHKTLIELFKQNPDLSIARQGFLEGRNHPNDIDGMINLFQRFHNINYIHRAIVLWSAADSAITPFIPLGAELHHEIVSTSPSPQKIAELLNQIKSINKNLTLLEDEFSFTLGEGSRWLENLILKLLFGIALTVEISGVLLTVSVSRGIQKGLNEIIRVSKKIAKGDFSSKAKAYSSDEIGILANAFNQMSKELSMATESLKKYAHKLEEFNQSLKQFAYVASHDLKEPLRKINTFSSRLRDEYENAIDERARGHLNKIENASLRMQKLIDDILNFSRINSEIVAFENTDLNKVMNQVLSDMEILIENKKAKITFPIFSTIEANPSQIGQLFQNIISNSLKFINSEVVPEIKINNEEIYGSQIKSYKNFMRFKFSGTVNAKLWEQEKFCKITFHDNGIGFESSYAERIFEVFQRLNSNKQFEGTGIGLAICKKIIDNHHGIITAESIPGHGATFIIILPFSQANFEMR